MLKRLVCVAGLTLLLAPTVHAQSDDAVALRILDRMASVIGDLGSCSFTLSVAQHVLDHDAGELVTRFSENDIYLLGPDKMTIDVRRDDAHRGFWYDGKTLAYYSYDENNYAVVKAPDTIVETFEMVHRDYGIDFPASDFFYPTLTDDLIEHTDAVQYLGMKQIDGQNCFHILAKSKDLRIQIWVANDALTLPVRYSVARLDEKEAPEYAARFSNWQLNPTLPETMFTFSPPATAAEIALLPKSGKIERGKSR